MEENKPLSTFEQKVFKILKHEGFGGSDINHIKKFLSTEFALDEDIINQLALLYFNNYENYEPGEPLEYVERGNPLLKALKNVVHNNADPKEQLGLTVFEGEDYGTGTYSNRKEGFDLEFEDGGVEFEMTEAYWKKWVNIDDSDVGWYFDMAYSTYGNEPDYDRWRSGEYPYMGGYLSKEAFEKLAELAQLVGDVRQAKRFKKQEYEDNEIYKFLEKYFGEGVAEDTMDALGSELAVAYQNAGEKTLRRDFEAAYKFPTEIHGSTHDVTIPYADLLRVVESDPKNIITFTDILKKLKDEVEIDEYFSDSYYSPDNDFLEPELENVDRDFIGKLEKIEENLEEKLSQTADMTPENLRSRMDEYKSLLKKFKFRQSANGMYVKKFDIATIRILKVDIFKKIFIIEYEQKGDKKRKYTIGWDQLGDYATTPLLFKEHKIKTK